MKLKKLNKTESNNLQLLKTFYDNIRDNYYDKNGKTNQLSYFPAIQGYTEGKKVAQFIEKNYIMGRIDFVDFHPHTANPIAFDEIMACKRSIIKFINKTIDEYR